MSTPSWQRSYEQSDEDKKTKVTEVMNPPEDQPEEDPSAASSGQQPEVMRKPRPHLQVGKDYLSDSVVHAREAVESLLHATSCTWPSFAHEVESQALHRAARIFLQRLEGIRCDSVQHTFQHTLQPRPGLVVAAASAAAAPPGEAAKK
eukprot:4821542-Heterocapsa_arctica.AAC.1